MLVYIEGAAVKWVKVQPKELAIGSIYKIEEDDEKFVPGIYLSLGHWLEAPEAVCRSRLLIMPDQMKLPIYPSMSIAAVSVVYDQLCSKGMYLMPHELLRCFAKDGIDWDLADKYSYYLRAPEKEHKVFNFSCLMHRLFKEQIGNNDKYFENLED